MTGTTGINSGENEEEATQDTIGIKYRGRNNEVKLSGTW